MNIANCTKNLLFSFFIFASFTTQLHAKNEITAPEESVQTEQDYSDIDLASLSQEQLYEMEKQFNQKKEKLEILTEVGLTQTKKTDGILESLAGEINANAFGGKNKKKLLNQIKAVRSIVAEIKKQTFVEVSPETIQFLVAFNELLLEHIKEAVKKGFEDFPSIENKLPTLQKRCANISIETIEEKIEQIEQNIFQLAVSSQSIGLTWYNKASRAIYNLLAIAHRRKWDSRIMIASVLGSIGLHALSTHTEVGCKIFEKLRYKAKKLKLKLRTQGISESSCLEIRNEIAKLEAQATFIENYSYNQLLTHEVNNQKKQILTAEEIKIKIKDVKNLEQIQKIVNESNQLTPSGFFKECAYLKQKNKPWPVFSWAARKFRNITGMNPIWDDGMLLNPEQVTLLGQTGVAVKATAAIAVASYLPIMRAFYGESWHLHFGGWIVKKTKIVFSKLIGGNLGKQMEKEQKEINEGSEPKYTFDDVVGLDHIKRTLENVLEYIKNPERFDRANIPPERGYLFTGLPGTGKSFVAEAFGGEIRKIFKELGRDEDELGFYSLSAELINEKGISWVLDVIKDEAPCVIFIDEIDLLNLQRGKGDSKMLSEFLGSMSGFLSKESSKQVILLAATNRPEHLDKALRRRGRFGKIIHFELPTIEERKQFIIKKLDPLLPDLNIIDIDKISEETEGRTYEELAVMINSAFQTTKRTGIPISQELLEEAFDEEIRNIMSHKELTISDQEQTLIASHQAGHALALELLQPRRELAAVTILPIVAKLQDEDSFAQYYTKKRQQDVFYGKTFTRCSFDHLDVLTYDEKIKECKILLAGMCAEKILLGACGHSYHANDKQKALNVIKSLVFEGLHIKTMPKKIQLEYFQKALKLLAQCEKEIKDLFEQNKEILSVVAQDLKKYKTITAKKMKSIIAENSK
ncbi:AAA family ATPase [bacterium]|nr:AAA family ATPase [bacterium]